MAEIRLPAQSDDFDCWLRKELRNTFAGFSANSLPEVAPHGIRGGRPTTGPPGQPIAPAANDPRHR